MSRTTSGKEKEIPFGVDRNLKTALAEQLADGLRKCILSGRYKPGDILPSLKELVARLGVSQRVAREAIHILVADGLAMVRPRSGCRVLAPTEKSRRGRILSVLLDHHRTSYNTAIFESEMERRLVEAGYVVEVLYLPIKPTGECDLSLLEDKLRSPFDLVFSRYAVARLERRLARSGIPYVALDTPRRVPGAAAVLRDSSEDARRRFLMRCESLGIRTAWVAAYGSGRHGKSISNMMEQIGISVERQRIPISFGYGNLERLERTGYRTAFRRFARGRRFPDLAVVMDDYFLRGMLTALAELGVRIPDQLRLVALVNDGFVPTTTVPLATFRVDARRWAKVACMTILQILAGRKPPTEPCAITDFIDGPSLVRA